MKQHSMRFFNGRRKKEDLYKKGTRALKLVFKTKMYVSNY